MDKVGAGVLAHEVHVGSRLRPSIDPQHVVVGGQGKDRVAPRPQLEDVPARPVLGDTRSESLRVRQNLLLADWAPLEHLHAHARLFKRCLTEQVLPEVRVDAVRGVVRRHFLNELEVAEFRQTGRLNANDVRVVREVTQDGEAAILESRAPFRQAHGGEADEVQPSLPRSGQPGMNGRVAEFETDPYRAGLSPGRPAVAAGGAPAPAALVPDDEQAGSRRIPATS